MKPPAHITPNALVTQMTALAYERRYAFSQGEIDATTLCINEQRHVGTSVEDIKRIYDERTVSFTAERTQEDAERKLILPPNLFTITYSEKTHLSQLPPALTPHLPAETVSTYSDCFFGELHEVQSVRYTVEKDGRDIDMNRDITYELRGLHETLYTISEIDESKESVQWIPLAHDGQSLRVERRISEEQAEDQTEQFFYNDQFEKFRDGLTNADFYADFVRMRENEATVCISALLQCIRRGSRIPSYDEIADYT
jgi:hypothetical protein